MRTCGSTTTLLTYVSTQINEGGPGHLPIDQTWIFT